MDDVNIRLVWRACIFLSIFIVQSLLPKPFRSCTFFSTSKPIMDACPLPFRIIEPFYNTSEILSTPQIQDERWDRYKEYFSRYQARLTGTSHEYYVIYSTTYSGLANKLNGLVSSLLIAMVTNRGLLRRPIYFV